MALPINEKRGEDAMHIVSITKMSVMVCMVCSLLVAFSTPVSAETGGTATAVFGVY